MPEIAASSEPPLEVLRREEAMEETAKLVVVACVPVALRKVKFCKVVEAVVCKAPVESILKSSVPRALVKERNLPAKEVVEEATIKLPVVPVAFTWNKADLSSEAVVVAPTTNDLKGEDVAERKSPETESSSVLPKEAPESSVSQPKVPPAQVKTLSVWQVARPAPLKEAVNKLEEEAVVEKKLVEVALVEVELTAVKFCSVVEPTTKRSPEVLMVVVAVPPILKLLPVSCPPKRLVEVAAVVVERVMLLKMWAPVQVGEKA